MSEKKRMGKEMLKEFDLPVGSTYFKTCLIRQGELQKFYMTINKEILKNTRKDWIRENCEAICDESSEIRDWLPWKHWKKYDNFKIEWEEIRFELADILHFILNSIGYLHDWNIETITQIMGRVSGTIRPFHSDSKEDLSGIKANMCYDSGLLRYENMLMNKAASFLYSLCDDFDEEVNGIITYNKVMGMIDTILFHFFNCCTYSGINNADLMNYYLSKNQENFDRQKRGY